MRDLVHTGEVLELAFSLDVGYGEELFFFEE